MSKIVFERKIYFCGIKGSYGKSIVFVHTLCLCILDLSINGISDWTVSSTRVEAITDLLLYSSKFTKK